MATQPSEEEKVFQSIQGIKRAVPNQELFGKIMAGINHKPVVYVYFSNQTLIHYAAAAVLLIAVNFFSVFTVQKSAKQIKHQQENIQQFAQEYFEAQSLEVITY